MLEYARTDVLVLGAGLAGMRAALAAAEAGASSVLLISPFPGPTGSSFTNVNDALGVQAALDDAERASLRRDILAAAGPGHVEERLVSALVADSAAALEGLLDLGLAFRRTGSGEMARVPGCFSADPRAFVFTGLADAHARLQARLARAGIGTLAGYTVRDIITIDGAAAGALIESSPGHAMAVQAGAVIAALGGPAPLYRRSISGSLVSGWSYGILARAGATLTNAQFPQFLWLDAESRAFFPVQDLLTPACRVRTAHGALSLPAELFPLAQARAAHCPFGHGLEDTAIDLFLASHMQDDGTVEILAQDGAWRSIAPFAQAGNGGSLIDGQGRTSVPGLMACGESASGMHGANRVGGCMVLACLVFGRRAGETAARVAEDAKAPIRSDFEAAAGSLPAGPAEDAATLAWLRGAMERHAGIGRQCGRADFIRQADARRLPDAFTPALDSALAVLGRE